MKRILLAIVEIFFIATLCLAQEQNVYHNSEGHFLFILPNGWEESSKSGVDEWSNMASKLSGENVRYIAVFCKTIGETAYSIIVIQINSKGRKVESSIQQFMTSQEQQEVTKNRAQEYVKNIPVDFGKFVYNKEKNILFQKAKMNVGNEKKIVVTAIVMSNYGFVNLGLTSSEENIDNDLNDFNKIIDSFKFDEGYRY
jgi:hypothetical protein